MAEVDQIVEVSISTSGVTPSQTNFGIPMIPAFHTENTDLIRFYTTLAEAEADGHDSGLLHDALVAAFSQDPHPDSVAVGRLTTGSLRTVKLLPFARNTHAYVVTINGTVITSAASDANATQAEIVALLITAINASAENAAVTASAATTTDANDTLQIISDTAGLLFSLEVDYADYTTVNDITPATSPTLATQLAAIQVASGEWYGLLPLGFGAIESTAAMLFAETNLKFAVCMTQNTDVIGSGSGDIASTEKALAHKQGAIFFSKTPHDFKNVALMSLLLPKDPGSYTAKFKTLASTTADALTSTETTNLRAKNALHYIAIKDVSITTEGKTAHGQFIDTTIYLNWLKDEIQTRVFQVLAANDKVPFTDPGIALIGNAIQGALLQGETQGGGVKDSSTVTVPRASAVSALNKDNRLLTPVTFEQVLAGAVHKTTIAGKVTN